MARVKAKRDSYEPIDLRSSDGDVKVAAELVEILGVG